MDKCITLCRKPKDHYLNNAKWDVNGIRYKVSGFSAMSLQLTLELLQRRYTGIVRWARSYYAM